MPPRNFKSVTVPEFVYDHFEQYYLSHRVELGNKGIFSLTSFVEHTLEQSHKDSDILRRFAAKIKKIPQWVRVYL